MFVLKDTFGEYWNGTVEMSITKPVWKLQTTQDRSHAKEMTIEDLLIIETELKAKYQIDIAKLEMMGWRVETVKEKKSNCCDYELPPFKSTCHEVEFVQPNMNNFEWKCKEDHILDTLRYYADITKVNTSNPEKPETDQRAKSINHICIAADKAQNNEMRLNEILTYLKRNPEQYSKTNYTFAVEHVTGYLEKIQNRQSINKYFED